MTRHFSSTTNMSRHLHMDQFTSIATKIQDGRQIVLLSRICAIAWLHIDGFVLGLQIFKIHTYCFVWEIEAITFLTWWTDSWKTCLAIMRPSATHFAATFPQSCNLSALAAVSHPRPCGTGKGTLPEGEGRISQFPGDPSCWPPPDYRPDCYPAMQPIRVKTAWRGFTLLPAR